jgi:hypothetical protein
MKNLTLSLAAAVLAISIAGPATATAPQPPGLNDADQMQTVERRKKRVKGGSGCDDPGDVAEHPECR